MGAVAQTATAKLEARNPKLETRSEKLETSSNLQDIRINTLGSIGFYTLYSPNPASVLGNLSLTFVSNFELRVSKLGAAASGPPSLRGSLRAAVLRRALRSAADSSIV